MTVTVKPISIGALRKALDTYPATSSGVPPVEVRRSSLLALVEAVEALRSLHAGLTCERDPMDVDERIVRAGAALARFDSGENA